MLGQDTSKGEGRNRDKRTTSRVTRRRRQSRGCARLAARDRAAVEASDGWRFARHHDPALAHELLRLLEDAARRRASREAYRQLAEAMHSLDRIFAAGGNPCATEDGLRLLMRHFAVCARKDALGGCARCRRLLQLFRLRLRPGKAGPTLPRPPLQVREMHGRHFYGSAPGRGQRAVEQHRIRASRREEEAQGRIR